MKNLVISRKWFYATQEDMLHLSLQMATFSLFLYLKKQSPSRYRELQFNNLSGHEILNLIGAKSISDYDLHHNDPLLSRRKSFFGKAGGSQRELDNFEIERGDLFFIFLLL